MTKTHSCSSTLLNVFFAFVLATAFAPTAWADNTSNAASSQVESLLQANPYEEGTALALVKNQGSKPDSATLLDRIVSLFSSSASSNEIANATQIMTVSQEAYEAATGEKIELDEGVSPESAFSIIEVHDPESTTKNLLETLLANKRVVTVEPNYLYEVDGTSAENSSVLAKGLEQLGTQQASADSKSESAKNAIVAIMDTGADVQATDTNAAFAVVDLTSLNTDYACAPQGLNTVSATNTSKEKPAANDVSDTTGHGSAVASAIIANLDAQSLNADELGLIAIRVGGEAQTKSKVVYEDAALRGYAFLADAADAGLNLAAVNASWGGTGTSTVLGIAAAELGLAGTDTVCALDTSEKPSLTSPFASTPFAIALAEDGTDADDEGALEPGGDEAASEETEDGDSGEDVAETVETLVISKASISGDNIVLKGTGFGTDQGSIRMKRGTTTIDINDPSVISWTDTKVVFEAPNQLVSGTWIIKATNANGVSGKIKAKLELTEVGPGNGSDTPNVGPADTEEQTDSPSQATQSSEDAQSESAATESAPSESASTEFGMSSSTNQEAINTPKTKPADKADKDDKASAAQDEQEDTAEASEAEQDDESTETESGSLLLKILGVMVVLGLIAAIIAVFYFQKKEDDDDDPGKPASGGFDFGNGSDGNGGSFDPTSNGTGPVAAATIAGIAAGSAASGPKHAAPSFDADPIEPVEADAAEPAARPTANPASEALSEEDALLGATTAFAVAPIAALAAEQDEAAASEAAAPAIEQVAGDAAADAADAAPAPEAETASSFAALDDAFAAGATTSFTPIDVSQLVAEEKGKILSAEAERDSAAALDSLFSDDESPVAQPEQEAPQPVSFSAFMRSGGVIGAAAATNAESTSALEPVEQQESKPAAEPSPEDTGRVLVDGRPHYKAGSTPLVEVGLSSNGLVGASAPRRIHKTPTKRRETFVRRGSRQYRP